MIMVRKIFVGVLLGTMLLQLSGCAAHCKEPGCDESEIYQDGYCKYHYYKNLGEDALSDIMEGSGDEALSNILEGGEQLLQDWVNK